MSNLRYMHFPFSGGGTVAYAVNGDRIYTSVAFCNTRDQFNRKRGRLIAGGRWKLAFEKGSTRPCVDKANVLRYDPALGKPAHIVRSYYGPFMVLPEHDSADLHFAR